MSLPQQLPPLRDFDPRTRVGVRFGYSAVAGVRGRVARLLGLSAALPYPRGVDGNHWVQGNVLEPGTLAQAIPWGYWKLTDGLTFLDSSAPLAITLKQAGMEVMVFYHFFRRNLSGKPQAIWFDTNCQTYQPALGGKKIAVVDYETDEGVDNVKGKAEFIALCNELHARGYLVVLYINNADWVAFGMGSWVEGYVEAYIIAHWKANNSPTIPAGIDPAKVLAQQEGVWNLQAHVLPVPGAKPQFDCNLLLWTMNQLKTFTGQGGLIPPPVPGDPPLPALAKGLISGLKVRSRPTTSESNQVGSLALDEVVTVYAVKEFTSQEKWLLIRKQDDRAGWAAMKHPTLTGPGLEWK